MLKLSSESFSSWNYNARKTISFSDSKISYSFIHVMIPIDFTDDQNSIRRVIKAK